MIFQDEESRVHLCKYFASSVCFIDTPSYARRDLIRDIRERSVPLGMENNAKIALNGITPIDKISIEAIDNWFHGKHNTFSDCKARRGKILNTFGNSAAVYTPVGFIDCNIEMMPKVRKGEYVIVHGNEHIGNYAFK